MTTFAEPPPSSAVDDSCQSISEIIYTHFDSHQRDSSNNNKNVSRAAEAMHHDILSFVLSHNNNDGGKDGMTQEEISKELATAVTNCMDAAMSMIATTPPSKKDSWSEAVTSTLQLAAAYSTSSGKDEVLARTVITRAIEYLSVERDTIRIESCHLLGACVRYLMESSKPAASILKKKGGSTMNKNTNNTANRVNETAGWKMECLIDIGKAMVPRLTDKIAKVRSAAISATAHFFTNGAKKAVVIADSKDYEKTMNSIQNTLLWIMSNDSSAPNRALVAIISGRVSEETIPHLIERVKDVDVKVREAALDALRVNVSLDDLTEDQRVEILRYGLTKRCPSTHAKAVELLCANWLKSAKFDPIALLDSLNPVLNETVCELATEVIINMASKIDCEDSDDERVELVKKHFGGPEVRTLQQQILKKRCIPQSGGEEKEEEELSPSLAFFLRVKCNSASNKMDTMSDIIGDIPTLCNLLNNHVDKLIEFSKEEEEDDDEMDEEEREEYEDAQNFICLQLIHMANTSELQEEGSRRHFISIMRSMLSRLATPDDLVDACVKTMALAHDTESHFLQTISEILVDIEDDHSTDHDEKAIVVVRQMRTISILSFVLENIGGKMVGNPILTSTLQHLLPAVTSKNAVIREHGVICLSKFCLLSEEDKIVDEFKPLLMQIASSVEERVEVRAQAMLALCDLTLLHRNMMQLFGDEGDNNESTTFKELLLEMLGHSKQGIAVIAAEVAAKLLLAGCFHDSTIIAWLLVIYFDANLAEVEDEDDFDGSEVKKVGSPVRLQQLLSIFFPTYSMSSLDANDELMASVGPLLTIVNGKLEGKKQAKALNQWPIAKMVEYICYNVDLADKKKEEKSADETDQAENDEEGGQVKEEVEGETQAEVVPDDDETTVVEASSTLLASIDIAEFLSEEGASAPTYYNRALAKMLGSASIDVDAEDNTLLSRLKSHVAEAEYATDDGPTVNQIKKLLTLLVDVADFEEDERSYSSEDTSGEPDEEEEEEEREEESVHSDKASLSGDESFATATFEKGIEKENARLSMGSLKSPRLSIGSMKSAIEHESEVEETPSKRVSLGTIN